MKNISGADIPFRFSIINGTIYKGSLFLYNDNYYQVCSVHICDLETMNSHTTLNPYPVKGQQGTHWSNHPFSETADGITFIKPYSDTLFHFDGTSVKPRFVFEHTTPLATQQVFDTYSDLKQLKRQGIADYFEKHNYFVGIGGVIETSDYLFISSGGRSYIWNKNLKKGGSEGSAYVYKEKDIYRRRLTGIISSTDECFIAELDYSHMKIFKYNAEKGKRIDPGMQKILPEWKENDNPVVALYYMKKEI